MTLSWRGPGKRLYRYGCDCSGPQDEGEPGSLEWAKAISDVTLLVAEAGRRGNGDEREGHSQESTVLNGGTVDGEGYEPSDVWVLSIWERKPGPLRA